MGEGLECVSSHKQCEKYLDETILPDKGFLNSFKELGAKYRIFMFDLEQNHNKVYGLLRKIGLPKPYKGTYEN